MPRSTRPLSRTVITHGATSIVVTTLLVLGGETLRGFATAFLVGIIVGTYSSIYIASASALDLGLSAADLLSTRKGKAPGRRHAVSDESVVLPVIADRSRFPGR